MTDDTDTHTHTDFPPPDASTQPLFILCDDDQWRLAMPDVTEADAPSWCRAPLDMPPLPFAQGYYHRDGSY